MSRLVEEVKEWNTPLVGAYLLWQFNKSYVENHPVGDTPIVIEDFVAYTLLINNCYNENINGHRENIASYIRSFTENNKSDLLACLSDRIREQMCIAMESIDIAVSVGLLAWDIDSAKLFPILEFSPKRGSGGKGISVLSLKRKANILGKWFSNSDMNTALTSLGVIL